MEEPVNTVDLHHVEAGPADAPVVVLGPAIGATHDMWRHQIPALAQTYRVIAFDTRGHGESPVPPGPYAVAELAADVLALLDRLDVPEFSYCGLSLGGAIGQEIALQAPERLDRLVLACTASTFGSAFAERAAQARAEGLGWLVETTRARWFTPAIDGAERQHADDIMRTFAATDPEGYASCCDALATFDTRGWLEQITAPTLVIAGEHDPATPVEAARVLEAGIPDAELLVVADAAHLANVEQPALVTVAITRHLATAGIPTRSPS